MEKLKIDFGIDENNELLREMKKAYLECPKAIKYCKDLKIPEEKIDKYITKIFDFVMDLNHCSKCKGTQNCTKENPYLVSTIDYQGSIVESTLSPCKKIVKRIAFEKQFQVRDFPEEWLDKTLREDVNATKEKKEALKIYTSFFKEQTFSWIYLTGGAGTGRSFFTALLCVDAANKSYGPICFINSAKRIRELSDLAKKNPESFQKELERYSNARILVLDDYGNEYVNDYVRDTVIYPILSTRNSKKLLTIFTSDFSIDEIEALYSTSLAGAIRAKQIAKIIRANAKSEIDLGTLPLY